MCVVVEAIHYLSEFAKKEGIYLFNNVSIEMPDVFAPDGMDIKSFVNVAKLLECKIIYNKTVLLSAIDLEYPEDEEDEDYEELMESEKKEFVEVELQKLSKKWSKKLGSPKWTEIVFYHAGVSHHLTVLETWYNEYRADLDSVNKSAQLFAEKENIKLETSKEGLKEEIEQNIERWSHAVAEDKEFQKARSFRAKMHIVLRIFPDLKGEKYYTAIDEIIKTSLVIAESNLLKEIYKRHDKGESPLSISANLDISRERVKKALAKDRI